MTDRDSVLKAEWEYKQALYETAKKALELVNGSLESPGVFNLQGSQKDLAIQIVSIANGLETEMS